MEENSFRMSRSRRGSALEINYHKKGAANCARFSTSMRVGTVRILYQRLSGLLLGVWISTSCLKADVCSQAREALQRRDLSAAEGLLKQCATANPTLLGPVLDLC